MYMNNGVLYTHVNKLCSDCVMMLLGARAELTHPHGRRESVSTWTVALRQEPARHPELLKATAVPSVVRRHKLSRVCDYYDAC